MILFIFRVGHGQIDLTFQKKNPVGLDPPSRNLLSGLLDRISSPPEPTRRFSAQVVLGLRTKDAIPAWSTHVVYVAGNRVLALGEKDSVVQDLSRQGVRLLRKEGESDGGLLEKVWAGADVANAGASVKGETQEKDTEQPEALVEMEDVRIAYFGSEILSGFSWTIRRGERWGLFGPNGTPRSGPYQFIFLTY